MNSFITIEALPDVFSDRILYTTTIHSCRIPEDMKEIDAFICQKSLCPKIEFEPLFAQYINHRKQMDRGLTILYNELYERIVNEGEKLLGDYKHYLKTRLNTDSTREEIYKVVLSLAETFQNVLVVR